jgi:hypothetical protein
LTEFITLELIFDQLTYINWGRRSMCYCYCCLTYLCVSVFVIGNCREFEGADLKWPPVAWQSCRLSENPLFQKVKSGYSHKKISLSFQLDSFFILVSKESSIHATVKTMPVICIEHAFVIQNIPIFLSEFIKPKSNWFKHFVYDLFKTE